MNSVERDGRCRPGLPLPLPFAPAEIDAIAAYLQTLPPAEKR